MTLTSQQLHILQHSLGVDKYGQGEQYRNHFVTGRGSKDWDDCLRLCVTGMMKHRKNPIPASGDFTFQVTEQGKLRMATESPPAPKNSKGRRRYREWLKIGDMTGLTFIEWLQSRKGAKP